MFGGMTSKLEAPLSCVFFVQTVWWWRPKLFCYEMGECGHVTVVAV